MRQGLTVLLCVLPLLAMGQEQAAVTKVLDPTVHAASAGVWHPCPSGGGVDCGEHTPENMTLE